MADESKVTGLTDPLSRAKFAERWQIVEPLGQGGTATVYRGRDTHTGNRVAIKVLHPHLASDPKIVKRFLWEVGAASQIENQHVGKVYDWGRADEAGMIFIISELLSGETLQEALGDPPRPMPFGRIRKIGRGILRALIAAHEQGVVHRDLKPGNIFLVHDAVSTDFVKVIDFGIAKVTKVDTKLTVDKEAIGTPLYMSPEQCTCRPIGPQSDLYSLGVVLYEMATSRVPFPQIDEEGNERGPLAVLADHVDPHKVAPPPHLFRPDIPPELELVILRALNKKLDERIQTAAEFYLALSGAIPAPSEDDDSQRVSVMALREKSVPKGKAYIPGERAQRLLPRYPEGLATPAVPPVDASSTPTHLLDGTAAAAGMLGRAATFTPADLKREVLQEKVVAILEMTVGRFGAWAGKIGPFAGRSSRYLVALIIFIIILALSAVVIPISGGNANASDGDIGKTETADGGDMPDVVFVPVPVIISPREVRDAEAERPEDVDRAENASSEADAGPTEVEVPAETDVAETEATTESTDSPDGYEELLTQGTVARREGNFVLAEQKFKAATELRPEGARGWRELGDARVILGRRTEAKAAYQEYLQLAPNASDADSISRRITRW